MRSIQDLRGTGLGTRYLFMARQVWMHLPRSVRVLAPGQIYGRHLHTLVRQRATRRQSFGTFFLRNRPELELMGSLVDQKRYGSSLRISVLACSKGAEVYSIAWAIGSKRPDLKLGLHAIDICQEILDFAERGVYSLESADDGEDISRTTSRDQNASIFERMTASEVDAMCEVIDGRVRVKSWLKKGITWMCGDAGDPDLVRALGPQDIVVANRFLCHMEPGTAERCLRNVARMVRPGGYLFVSGIDLDVRTRVARRMGWRPITDRLREIHEGDASLRHGWPLEYWGLEPFRDDRPDWSIRYASVFQVGAPTPLSTIERH